jgi:ribosomal protein S7
VFFNTFFPITINANKQVIDKNTWKNIFSTVQKNLNIKIKKKYKNNKQHNTIKSAKFKLQTKNRTKKYILNKELNIKIKKRQLLAKINSKIINKINTDIIIFSKIQKSNQYKNGYIKKSDTLNNTEFENWIISSETKKKYKSIYKLFNELVKQNYRNQINTHSVFRAELGDALIEILKTNNHINKQSDYILQSIINKLIIDNIYIKINIELYPNIIYWKKKITTFNNHTKNNVKIETTDLQLIEQLQCITHNYLFLNFKKRNSMNWTKVLELWYKITHEQYIWNVSPNIKERNTLFEKYIWKYRNRESILKRKWNLYNQKLYISQLRKRRNSWWDIGLQKLTGTYNPIPLPTLPNVPNTRTIYYNVTKKINQDELTHIINESNYKKNVSFYSRVKKIRKYKKLKYKKLLKRKKNVFKKYRYINKIASIMQKDKNEEVTYKKSNNEKKSTKIELLIQLSNVIFCKNKLHNNNYEKNSINSVIQFANKQILKFESLYKLCTKKEKKKKMRIIKKIVWTKRFYKKPIQKSTRCRIILNNFTQIYNKQLIDLKNSVYKWDYDLLKIFGAFIQTDKKLNYFYNNCNNLVDFYNITKRKFWTKLNFKYSKSSDNKLRTYKKKKKVTKKLIKFNANLSKNKVINSINKKIKKLLILEKQKKLKIKPFNIKKKLVTLLIKPNVNKELKKINSILKKKNKKTINLRISWKKEWAIAQKKSKILVKKKKSKFINKIFNTHHIIKPYKKISIGGSKITNRNAYKKSILESIYKKKDTEELVTVKKKSLTNQKTKNISKLKISSLQETGSKLYHRSNTTFGNNYYYLPFFIKDFILNKFTNNLMREGKKQLTYKTIFKSLNIIKSSTGLSPIKVLKQLFSKTSGAFFDQTEKIIKTKIMIKPYYLSMKKRINYKLTFFFNDLKADNKEEAFVSIIDRLAYLIAEKYYSSNELKKKKYTNFDYENKRKTTDAYNRRNFMFKIKNNSKIKKQIPFKKKY